MTKKKDTLRELATDYFLRDLSDGELSRLQDGLKSDPELGKYFIESARYEWLMNDYQQYRRNRTILFPERRRKKTVQRIAAIITVLLTLGGVFIAQRTVVRMVEPEKPMVYTAIATVQQITVQPGSSVSAVNQGNIRAVKFGEPLYDGDRVVVPVDCTLTYTYNEEETTVVMDGGSLFAVSDHDGAKRIHVMSGLLQAQVDKQLPDRPMKISTHDAEVVVLGTAFQLLVDQYTHLKVESGQVRFATRSDDQSVEVGAGMVADSRSLATEVQEILTRVLLPVQDDNIGLKNHNIMHIDPKRNHQVYLKFDLGELPDNLAEARLRLRVCTKRRDGGGGCVRLHAVPAGATPDNALNQIGKQLAEFRGNVDVGETVEFVIDPANLQDGFNTMIVTLDRQGCDDIWFGSTETGEAPELILQMKAAGK